MNLLARADETAKRCLEIETCETGWAIMKENHDCVIYSKLSEDFPGHHVYKSDGIIPFSADKVFAYIYAGAEGPKREDWDPYVTYTEVVERLSSDVDVILTQTPSVLKGMIGAREFVDLVKVIHEPERIMFAAIGIEHPKVPHTKRHVRAVNYPSAVFFYRVPGKPEETRLVQIIQSDIRGKIPTSLMEAVVPFALTNTYSCVKSAVAKQKH